MTMVSNPRYVVQLIVLPKYLLNNIALSEVIKEKIDKSEMIYMYIIYDTVGLIYKNSFPDEALLMEWSPPTSCATVGR